MPQLIGLIRTMRPKQWLKNGFLFVPLVFDRKLDDVPYLVATIVGFVLMSLASSTIYLVNDLADIEADRAHPIKRKRPLPSGSLSVPWAVAAAIMLPLIVLPAAYLMDRGFAAIVILYLLTQIAYTFRLKHIVLIDVLTLASAYLLRVAAGTQLVEVQRFSPWLYLFTGMLALFLGIGKRRQELVLLQDQANNTRAILAQYSVALLDEMIVIVSAMSIVTYSLYTFTAEGLPTNHAMMLTIPFVLYGIFRYLYLIHVRGEGGAPDEVILRDHPLQATIILFGLSVVVILYLVR